MSLAKKEFFFFRWNWKWRLLACSIISGLYFIIIEPHLRVIEIEPSIKRLKEKYGCIIQYKNPEKFYTKKLDGLPEGNYNNIELEVVEKKMVPEVLDGLTDALNKYPNELIQKYLSAILIVGKITVSGIEGSAGTANSWIYISAPLNWGYRRHDFALSFHHEFSSLLFHGAPFPWMNWDLVNHGDFRYLERYEEIINAADLKNRQDPKLAHHWYEQGFVSDYGMSDMENDFNTYAELALGQPEKLRDLMQTYPRIAQKTQLLVKFYTRLAPEMCEHFESSGLTTNCGPS